MDQNPFNFGTEEVSIQISPGSPNISEDTGEETKKVENQSEDFGLDKWRIFVDVETTGLNPYENTIVEIGALAVNSYGHTMRFNARIPGSLSIDGIKKYYSEHPPVDLRALLVNKFTVQIRESDNELLSSGYAETDLIKQFTNWLIELSRTAPILEFYYWPNTFDGLFLDLAFKRADINASDVIFQRSIDVRSFAKILSDEGIIPYVKNLSLNNIYRALLGRDLLNPHIAIYDAIAVYEIYTEILKRLKLRHNYERPDRSFE